MVIQKADLSCHFDAIEEIFFLCSSRKSFATEAEKQEFFKRWTSYYFEHCSEQILVALNPGNQVIGYLLGCVDSLKAEPFIFEKLPAYSVFSDLFQKYPSHFHINTHPDYQGQGVGSKLLQHYCEKQRNEDHKGIHLVTSVGAKNIEFYKRNGFTSTEIRQWKDLDLLFMGRSL